MVSFIELRSLGTERAPSTLFDDVTVLLSVPAPDLAETTILNLID